MKAIYTTIWDDTEVIETSCVYSLDSKCVTDVETADVDDMDLDVLTDEYILLADGTEIREFFLEGRDF